ncbi:MAG: Glycosyltransferase [Candidatus Kaiserbacteria bacterium GW2011_GWA2_52_12]|uniref:Glycosyltransferase n=1 Tax=Candidatus Kaiserbacteria bacterium GW2011_GWA2_52_12 TaxID=1618671 RepID=A0A0G1X0D6_9BACT|nr:MAG: Glycosyltransferase [Candidatus Kaiserbacteria bacterium GW2011_GWA2_52_12]
MRIVIIIPTYNEAGSIGALLDEVRASLCEMPKYEWSVLVVDGHSTDGTAKIVREKAASDPAIYLFDEPEKRGIAMAYENDDIIQALEYAAWLSSEASCRCLTSVSSLAIVLLVFRISRKLSSWRVARRNRSRKSSSPATMRTRYSCLRT